MQGWTAGSRSWPCRWEPWYLPDALLCTKHALHCAQQCLLSRVGLSCGCTLSHAAGWDSLAVTTELSFAAALLGSCIKVPPRLVAKQAAVS